ncbi:MAG: hypothetical protein J7M14_02585 [Planctomycetes bacterium]|nr:hypothetical protein [Planctomycetota bacterium]
MMFIASVSTVLFNANPLLRFDGYFILADVLEIPNLSQRSRDYLYYLVKKYVWGARRPRNPAHSIGERVWFVIYGLASTAYRVYILFRILIFLTDRLPKQMKMIAVGFAVVSGAMWLIMPLWKFLRYLATNGELSRVRPRAIATTMLFVIGVFGCVGVWKAPDRARLAGVVEPIDMAVIYASVDGVLNKYLPSGQVVSSGSEPLIQCTDMELETEYERLIAERRKLEVRKRIAATQAPAAAQIMSEQLSALYEQIARVQRDRSNLCPKAPLDGSWIAPGIDQAQGAYLRRGDQVGLVANLDKLMIRTVAEQHVAEMILTEAFDRVEIRVKGRADLMVSGKILRRSLAGQKQLPSAALGYAAGGSIRTDVEDRQGIKAAEPVFEVHVVPDDAKNISLLAGQRVIVRFEMPPKPLMDQWWRSLLQLLQRKFRV